MFAKIVTPNGFDFYVPAIVIALPNHDVAEDKFYTVLKCNNRRVSRFSFRKEFLTRQDVVPFMSTFFAGYTEPFPSTPR